MRSTAVWLALALVAACGGDDDGDPSGDAGTDAGTMDAAPPVDAPEPDATAPRPARALILDQELRGHASWVDAREAIGAAGLEVDHRRFYPHLTDVDVDTYRLALLAAGRHPSTPSSRMRVDEIDAAVRFAEEGGALVLVPQPGYEDSPAGENDWFVAGRILERLGVPVRIDRNTIIGEAWVGPPAPPHIPVDWGYPTPLETNIGYPYVLTPDSTRLAGGQAPTLRVGSPEVDVLLRTYTAGYLWQRLGGDPAFRVVSLTSNRAVAVLARAGRGFVAVIPRGVMLLGGATGALSDKPAMDPERLEVNRAWLREIFARLDGLARGEVAFEVTEVRGSDELFRVAAPGHEALPGDGDVVTISRAPSELDVPEAPPDGDLLEEPPAPPPSPRAVPSWFSEAGGSVAYGDPPEASDLPVAFGEVVDHGLDALMLTTNPRRLVSLEGTDLDDEHARYAELSSAAEAAGARLFVGGYYGAAYLESGEPRGYPSMVGAHGGTGDAPAPVDPGYWNDWLVPTFAAVGEVAADNPGVSGLHVDTELYGGPVWHHDGWAFSESTIAAYASESGDTELASTISDAPPAERLDLLVDAGRLGDWLGTLEDVAAGLARRAREAARTPAPDLELMVYVPGFPDTWLYRGLLRGLGTAEMPVTVLTYEGWASRSTEALHAGGAHAAHLGGAIVGWFRPEDFDDVLVSLSAGNDGFWYFRFNDFSETNPMPSLHGPPDAYWDAVDTATGAM